MLKISLSGVGCALVNRLREESRATAGINGRLAPDYKLRGVHNAPQAPSQSPDTMSLPQLRPGRCFEHPRERDIGKGIWLRMQAEDPTKRGWLWKQTIIRLDLPNRRVFVRIYLAAAAGLFTPLAEWRCLPAGAGALRFRIYAGAT
jgi:hypothetical protein